MIYSLALKEQSTVILKFHIDMNGMLKRNRVNNKPLVYIPLAMNAFSNVRLEHMKALSWGSRMVCLS